MHKNYIEKLVSYIKNTKIYNANGVHIEDYNTAMEQLVTLFSQIKIEKKQVFLIGNGGSSAIASHMTADFMKNGGMRTYSLYDNAVTTCMGNDYGYEWVFSRPLELLAGEGDLLVAVSSSGNSQNIVNAIEVAKRKKCVIVTFSGFEENNKIIKTGDYNIYVPVCHYGMVESIHNLILQQIVDTIAERDGVCL